MAWAAARLVGREYKVLVPYVGGMWDLERWVRWQATIWQLIEDTT